MNDKLYNICINKAKLAKRRGEVPIAAIIYHKKNNKYFVAHNKTNKTKDPLMHAEIIVIKKMAKYLKNWRLNECEMFVTIEPCNMCKAIIKESRISKVYYGYKSNYYNNNTNNIEYINIEKKENVEIIKTFFKEKRSVSRGTFLKEDI